MHFLDHGLALVGYLRIIDFQQTTAITHLPNGAFQLLYLRLLILNGVIQPIHRILQYRLGGIAQHRGPELPDLKLSHLFLQIRDLFVESLRQVLLSRHQFPKRCLILLELLI